MMNSDTKRSACFSTHEISRKDMRPVQQRRCSHEFMNILIYCNSDRVSMVSDYSAEQANGHTD